MQPALTEGYASGLIHFSTGGSRMKRVFIALAVLVLGATVIADNRPGSGRFDLVEATIPSIQAAIQNNIITAEQLVQMYLARIAAFDAKSTTAHLNSYI